MNKTTIVKLPLQEVQAMMISYMRQTGKSLLEAELFAKNEVGEIIECASHNIKVLHENGELS